MQKAYSSLVLLVLLLPLSLGCGSSDPAAIGSQDEIAEFVAENPDSGVELEDTAGPADGP